MEKYHNAIRVFNQVVALDQKFKEAYYNRSLAYFKTRQFQKAKQDATKAVDIDPNYQPALELWKAIEKLH
jgi:tetratricopeptide (TPR) repeat protein